MLLRVAPGLKSPTLGSGRLGSSQAIPALEELLVSRRWGLGRRTGGTCHHHSA